MASTDVTPNHALRNAIEEWEETHCKTIARGALSPALFNAATQIGVGSFKEVHKATLSVPGAQAPTAVAVMRVRDGNVGAEAAMLLRLGRHPNLVRFLGLCKDGPDVLMVN